MHGTPLPVVQRNSPRVIRGEKFCSLVKHAELTDQNGADPHRRPLTIR